MSAYGRTHDQHGALFEDAMQVKSIGKNLYRAKINRHFGYLNSGFLVSVLVQCASLHFRQTQPKNDVPHTISIHTEFLLPCQAGDVDIVAKNIRAGRVLCTVHLTVRQKGKDVAVAYLTNSNINRPSPGVSIDHRPILHPPPAPADVSKFLTPDHPKDSPWEAYQILYNPKAEVPFASHVTKMLDVRRLEPSAHPDIKLNIADYWLTPTNPAEVFTNSWIPFVVDDIIPLAESMLPDPYSTPHSIQSSIQVARRWRSGEEDPAGRHKLASNHWYPTLSLNIDIKKRLPEEGVRWLFARQSAQVVQNGRLDCDITLMDQDGDIVALSRQVQLALPMAAIEGEGRSDRRKKKKKANL